jgi:hypothetical protein
MRKKEKYMVWGFGAALVAVFWYSLLKYIFR